MGVTMEQLGSDLSSMLSGNFVNRFNIDGRSYKVIPQIARSGRLTAAQLADIHVSGPGGQLIPLSAIASIRTGLEPRTLNRFQQLNAIKISGLPTRSLQGALQVLETTAAKILPTGSRIDYTGESRQLRQESGRFFSTPTELTDGDFQFRHTHRQIIFHYPRIHLLFRDGIAANGESIAFFQN